MDAHDLRRELHLEIRKRNFTSNSAQWARTISADCKSENATLPAFRAMNTHDPRTRKIILKLKFQTCNPSQELSPSASKHRIHGADSLRLPRKTQSFERQTPANVLATSTKHCACHDFHNVLDSLHLPLTLLTSRAEGCLAPAMQNEVRLRKRTRTPGITTPSKLRFPRRQLCAGLRSRNQQRISKRHSCANETRKSERLP